MAVVMIGVDPHKAPHTAVTVSADEVPLGQLRVRAYLNPRGTGCSPSFSPAGPRPDRPVDLPGGVG
jgi:hypothetical protein